MRLAQLQPGERVLIHAAAGGVGLAAIQIAQQIGAEVFATAGSDAKRDFLRSLGVQHVFSSRTLDFADEILEATERQGVDVVLNSLPGDAISKSLSILRAYGRFLEIGKTDIYQNRMIGLLPFQDNLSYFAIDLDRMLRQRPDTVRGLFAEVMEHFEQGDYRPLPLTEFAGRADGRGVPLHGAAQEHRQGGRGDLRRIGVAPRGRPQAANRRAAGIENAERQVAEAGVVRQDGDVLDHRRPRRAGTSSWRIGWPRRARPTWRCSPAGRRRLRLRQSWTNCGHAGREVAVLRGDAADRASLAAALGQIPPDFPPLRGVIHAAGVLDDGLLFDMSLEQLDRPMAPKVQGAWNLHAATRDVPLDFFVLFSSVASVLGSPGQANYAAGNALLDSLAAWRRRRGLPALSVNWGPWADSGMAAEAGRADQIQSRGMDLLPPQPALELLGKLLRAAPANLAVMDAQWSAMLRRMGGRVPPLLGEIAEQEAGGDQPAGGGRRRSRVSPGVAGRRSGPAGGHVARVLRGRTLPDHGDRAVAIGPRTAVERDRHGFAAGDGIEDESGTAAGVQPADGCVPGASQRDDAGGPRRPGRWRAGGAEGELPREAPADAAAAWSPIVTLQSAGDGPPVFCLHPLGGDVNCYRDLARSLKGHPRPRLARPRQRRPAAAARDDGGNDLRLSGGRALGSGPRAVSFGQLVGGRDLRLRTGPDAPRARRRGRFADAVRYASAVDLRAGQPGRRRQVPLRSGTFCELVFGLGDRCRETFVRPSAESRRDGTLGVRLPDRQVARRRAAGQLAGAYPLCGASGQVARDHDLELSRFRPSTRRYTWSVPSSPMSSAS